MENLFSLEDYRLITIPPLSETKSFVKDFKLEIAHMQTTAGKIAEIS